VLTILFVQSAVTENGRTPTPKN